jgi:invasion protein IalB
MALLTRVATVVAGTLLIAVYQAYGQEPQRTAATYGDWTVSCVMAQPPEDQRSCEMVQSQTIPGQPNPVGQITLRRPAKNDPFRIFFQIPANVWLQTGVKFVSDDKESGLVATFKWCIPSRCLADADLNDAALKKLRARTDPGRVEFKDATQHDVTLPVSFKGFAPALDLMQSR